MFLNVICRLVRWLILIGIQQPLKKISKNYPEQRFVAVGYLEDRLHVLCFSETNLGIRVISLRKANQREEKRYEKDIVPNE